MARPPSTGTRSASTSRPLLSAVSAASSTRREPELLNLAVTLSAWLVLVLAVLNAYVLIRTGGEVTADLPFTGYVEYTPAVVNVVTWGGHVWLPAGLSLLGAAGLGAAAGATRGVRQIGERTGPLLFLSILAALLGIAGSVIGLTLVALATAVGVAAVLLIGALLLAVCLILLAAFLSG